MSVSEGGKVHTYDWQDIEKRKEEEEKDRVKKKREKVIYSYHSFSSYLPLSLFSIGYVSVR